LSRRRWSWTAEFDQGLLETDVICTVTEEAKDWTRGGAEAVMIKPNSSFLWM